MLSEEILKAKQKGDLSRLFKRSLSSDLWILDDWAVVSLGREYLQIQLVRVLRLVEFLIEQTWWFLMAQLREGKEKNTRRLPK